MKKSTLILFLAFLINTNLFSQKITSESKLTLKENKYMLDQNLFSGMVVTYFENKQPKSIYEIREGIIKGKMTEFWVDKNYEHFKFQDTTEVSRLNTLLQNLSKNLTNKIKDTLVASNAAKAYLISEIGGEKKYNKMKLKNEQGNLKKNRVEFDKYEELEKLRNTSIREFKDISKSIKELNNEKSNELQKPLFIPTPSADFNQVNLVKDGNAIFYDILGKKSKEGVYKSGLQNGKWTYYYENGSKLAEGTFLNGEENNKAAEDNLPKNGREGKWFNYYKNGNIQRESNWLKGNLEGMIKTYFEGGKIHEEAYYKNGKLNGYYKLYSEEGKMIEEGNYINDLQDGNWKYYHENGKLKANGKFIKGDGGNKGPTGIPKNGRDGNWLFYYDNGKSQSDYHYINGKGVGIVKEYFQNGQLKEEGKFNADGVTYKRTKRFNEDGSIYESLWFIETDVDNYKNTKSKKIYTKIKGAEANIVFRGGNGLYSMNILSDGNRYIYSGTDPDRYHTASWYIKIDGVNQQFYSMYNNPTFISSEIQKALLKGTEVAIEIGRDRYYRFSLSGYADAVAWLDQQ